MQLMQLIQIHVGRRHKPKPSAKVPFIVFAETTIPQPTLSITINRPTNLLRAIIVEEMIRLKGHVG